MRFCTEPFPQRSLCTEQFLHMFLYTNICLTQRNLYTQTAHRSFYRPRFFACRNFTQSSFYTADFFLPRSLCAQKQLYIHSSFYRLTVFTHRKYQKVLRTEVLGTYLFTQNIFYIQTFLHTDVFTHTDCTQKLVHTARVCTYSQLLHREALFPLLDHLPFVFPRASEIYSAIRNLRRILAPCLSILGKCLLPLSALSQISWCPLWSWV